MQIQTGEAWNLEHITRQDLAVGNDDNYIGRKAADLFDGLWIFNSRGLKDRRARRLRPTNQRLFNWRRFNALLAPDSAYPVE